MMMKMIESLQQNQKKDVPADDKDSEDDEEQDNQENNEQEMIKKAYIREMFVKHFKSTLGPQDDDEEPHPAVAHMMQFISQKH